MTELVESSQLVARKAAVEEYNATNRWTKRGISMVPMRYGLNHVFASGTSCHIIIHASDGTVWATPTYVHFTCSTVVLRTRLSSCLLSPFPFFLHSFLPATIPFSVEVHCSASEMGQGIYAKVASTVAVTLGCEVDDVLCHGVNSSVSANIGITGGSIASEVACEAARKACVTLLERMKPVRDALEADAEKCPGGAGTATFAQVATGSAGWNLTGTPMLNLSATEQVCLSVCLPSTVCPRLTALSSTSVVASASLRARSTRSPLATPIQPVAATATSAWAPP